MKPFAKHCIYAISHGDKLAELHRKGSSGEFAERKPWITAGRLWQKAQDEHRMIPVLFGDATDCTELLYWGGLTKVSIQDNLTRYRVDRLRKLIGRHKPQELVLMSTGKRIASKFIRSYAICLTPDFLESER